MEFGDRRAGSSDQGFRGAAEAVGSGAGVRMLSRNRRLAKDYERRVQTSETLIKIAIIRLLLRRLERQHEPYKTRSRETVRKGV